MLWERSIKKNRSIKNKVYNFFISNNNDNLKILTRGFVKRYNFIKITII